METAAIRQMRHEDIDNCDDRLLMLILNLVNEYNHGGFEFEHDFTEEDIKLLDDRREKRQKRESKTYTWQDAKDNNPASKINNGISCVYSG